MRVARSRCFCNLNSSGVSSMNVVVYSPVTEPRMRDHLVEEAQVRLHAADAEFLQGAIHARDGLLRDSMPRR